MKKQSVILIFLVVSVFSLLLSGCSDNHFTMPESDFKSVEQVGNIPNEFKDIIENNIFNGITAFGGRLLKADSGYADKENNTIDHRVRMMDIYGKELASYSFSSEYAYSTTTLTATDDGGFLFVLGFSDYADSQNKWASENGFASHVIKCDEKGNVQFDTRFDGVEGSALEFCFEKNGRFYLFGTSQTTETKNIGVYSPTDIYMAILDQNGDILKSQHIAGSDYDYLNVAEVSGDHFVLSVNSQSDDGDFAASGSNGYPTNWIISVDNELNITEKKKESGRDIFDYKIGEKDGAPVYKSSSVSDAFDAGAPKAFIDYSDFYLIVSENQTGIYEKTPPFISSIWYYTETVYSAYDYNGKLLFRASADSSPDYDDIVDKYYS